MRALVVLTLVAGCATTEEPPGTIAIHPITVRLHQPSEPADAAQHEADCAAGKPVGCHAAALDHYYAHTAADDVAALERFRIACTAGYAPSCNGVGTMYAEGRAVPRDEVEAVRWFRAACASDGSTGCEHLAQAYETGRGVAKDPEAARAAHARGTCLFEHSVGHDVGPCAAAP
jgi:TPR repeat protein